MKTIQKILSDYGLVWSNPDVESLYEKAEEEIKQILAEREIREPKPDLLDEGARMAFLMFFNDLDEWLFIGDLEKFMEKNSQTKQMKQMTNLHVKNMEIIYVPERQEIRIVVNDYSSYDLTQLRDPEDLKWEPFIKKLTDGLSKQNKMRSMYRADLRNTMLKPEFSKFSRSVIKEIETGGALKNLQKEMLAELRKYIEEYLTAKMNQPFKTI